MDHMPLRLDPQLPLVWRDPHSLQVGIDPPRVVLHDVDDSLLPLLHALHSGMSRSGLNMLGKENSVAPDDITRLLETLAPVFEHCSSEELVDFVVDSPRVDSEALQAVWRNLGHRVSVTTERDLDLGGEVIIVVDFVLEPEHHHAWLRLDRAHTPIIFSDQSVVIGPRVEPGVGACLHCVWVAHQHTTPHALALASQLWGKRAPSRTPELQSLAAWLCHQLILSGSPGEVLRLDALTREVGTIHVEREKECGCGGLD